MHQSVLSSPSMSWTHNLSPVTNPSVPFDASATRSKPAVAATAWLGTFGGLALRFSGGSGGADEVEPCSCVAMGTESIAVVNMPRPAS